MQLQHAIFILTLILQCAISPKSDLTGQESKLAVLANIWFQIVIEQLLKILLIM